jgi:2-polyprenyl-6-methoxyphenol hydroxylase-like FAD-dependent oxidoreductase
VVGGGIAGPAVALFLARAGIEPVVCEAYPPSEDIGGGLQIAPNGMRVMAKLGLAEALIAEGHPCSDMAFRNHEGRIVGVIRTGRAGPGVNVMRAAVHKVLREEVLGRGLAIQYRKRLTGITHSGREVVATFDDGSTEVGDFLVGADGVHSRVRACILPEAAAPRDTQMISIGGFCAPGVTPPTDPHDASRLTFVVGPRYQFGYSKMGATQWGWWCHAHAADAGERDALMTLPLDALRDRMLQRYRGWCAPVADFIGSTEAWVRTPIADVPRLPTWRCGRVVLLGDAAHAMSPAGGQGASLALEDAQLFGQLVGDGPGSVEEAMSRFESLRRSRAERMVAQGYENDRRSLKQLGPFGLWMRDRLMMPVFARFIERGLNEVYTAPIA